MQVNRPEHGQFIWLPEQNTLQPLLEELFVEPELEEEELEEEPEVAMQLPRTISLVLLLLKHFAFGGLSVLQIGLYLEGQVKVVPGH